MKKKVFLLGLCLILATGCGKIPKLKNGEEAVVTFKDNKKLSVDDLYEKVKSEFALQSLISMIDKQLLESKYKNNIDEAKTYAETTIDSLKQQYGDDLQTMIAQYTGYQTIEAYQDSLYLNKLQEAAVEDYAKSEVTDKEIDTYYKDKVIGDIEVSHILITADVKDDMTDEEKTAAETKAKETADNLIKELKSAKDVKAKFEELAKSNSKDEATASNGGSLGFINYGTLSSDYDSLIDEAVKIKNGAISTTAIKTSLGYHIIYRNSQKEKSSLEDVKDTIIEKLAKEKMSNDSTISVKAMQALRKEYDVKIQDSELQKQYSNYIQNALSQNQSN